MGTLETHACVCPRVPPHWGAVKSRGHQVSLRSSLQSVPVVLGVAIMVLTSGGCASSTWRYPDLTPRAPGWTKPGPDYLDYVGHIARVVVETLLLDSSNQAFKVTIDNKCETSIRVSLSPPGGAEWRGPLCTYDVDDRTLPYSETPRVPKVLNVGETIIVPRLGSITMQMGAKFYKRWPPQSGDKVSFTIIVSGDNGQVETVAAEFEVAGIHKDVNYKLLFGH